MWEGALILLSGVAIGIAISFWIDSYRTKKILSIRPGSGYEKYKNKDGLYSRKLVKEVGDQS